MKPVLETVKKMIGNNWVLKVASLFVATVIWLSVVNVNDPTKTIIIDNIPITVINEEAITDNNQVYEIASKRYLSVTVTGRRSVLRDLSADNFSAVASLDELSVTSSVPVTVSLKNRSLETKVAIAKQSMAQITLSIENVETHTYSVTSNITGSVPRGYQLGNVLVNKPTVRITAPESLHKRIEQVIVNIDISGATSDFSDKYKLVLMDDNGNKISIGDNISLSKRKVSVDVSVLKQKKIPIVVETKGNPADGCEIKSITSNPKQITIVGPESLVNQTEQLTISGDKVDCTGITDSINAVVKSEDYLAEGLTVKDDSEIEINIVVQKYKTKRIAIDAKDIEISNIPAGYEAEISSNKVTIKVSGLSDLLENINADSFNASIDLRGVKEGRQEVMVNITIPDGITLESDVSVKVKMKKIS